MSTHNRPNRAQKIVQSARSAIKNAFVPQDNYTRVPNEISKFGLDAQVQGCYVHLAMHAQQDGYCWPSLETLARGMGKSVRQVQRYLGVLVRAGLVRVQRRGQALTNLYHLLTIDALRERVKERRDMPAPAAVSPPRVVPREEALAARPEIEPALGRAQCPDCGCTAINVNLGTCTSCETPMLWYEPSTGLYGPMPMPREEIREESGEAPHEAAEEPWAIKGNWRERLRAMTGRNTLQGERRDTR